MDSVFEPPLNCWTDFIFVFQKDRAVSERRIHITKLQKYIRPNRFLPKITFNWVRFVKQIRSFFNRNFCKMQIRCSRFGLGLRPQNILKFPFSSYIFWQLLQSGEWNFTSWPRLDWIGMRTKGFSLCKITAKIFSSWNQFFFAMQFPLIHWLSINKC